MLILNLLFSKLSENGVGDLVVHILFSDWVFWTLEMLVSTQVGCLLFSGQFEQTKTGGPENV